MKDTRRAFDFTPTGSVAGHVRIDYDTLISYSHKSVSDRLADLLQLVGCLFFVDRTVQRRSSKPWGRRLLLRVPVKDDRVWSAPATLAALVDCVWFVTGDSWEFEFIRVSDPLPALRQRSLCFEEARQDRDAAVVTYSGGLDSYAGARLLIESGSSPYLIHTRTTGIPISAAETLGLSASKCIPLLARVKLGGDPKRREPSGRTRTLLFLSIATVAAVLLGSKRVIVCENGQGSLGPTLCPNHWEWPYRATHPGFTGRFSKLVELVLGSRIDIEHPNLWQTKGQMLKNIRPDLLQKTLPDSKSCSRFPLRHKGVHPAKPCGICGGCLLRRVSLIAAGHENLEAGERYLWDDLETPTLAEGCKDCVTEISDQRAAYGSVLDMENLARLANPQESSAALRRLVSEICDACKIDANEAKNRLATLLAQHAQDWKALVKRLDRDSWIRKLTEGSTNE